MSKVSVASLSPADKDGYLTKQGEHYRTWKKRWFVLKGSKLVYFESPKDNEPKGIIEIDATSVVRDEHQTDKKKRLMFSVSTPRRVFHIYADNTTDMQQWMEAVKANIAKLNSGSNTPSPPSTPQHQVSTPQPPSTPVGVSSAPRIRYESAKNSVQYLLEDGNKVLEFWKIWLESIPLASELTQGMISEYQVAISADAQKLTWRAFGPQTAFIQKMVDFFWNVGAPESEIDLLNEVGAIINPGKIGSWIDMSGRGGMDGGWVFPFEMPLNLATEASDDCDATKKLCEWAEQNSITNCTSIGRDILSSRLTHMGAAPPRQTEFRIRLPGSDFTNQIRIAMDAFFAFGFPAIPEDALAVIKSAEASEGGPVSVVVVTSSEGFVKMGLLLPNPSQSLVTALCSLVGGQMAAVSKFESALGASGPLLVEYQYLMKGYGYAVYKEGFDVMFHYSAGEERG